MRTIKNFYGVLKESTQTPSFFVSNSHHSETTRAPRHSHEFGCLHFTTSGLYQEQVEGKKFEVDQGKILYKPPGIDHCNEFRNVGANTCRIELHMCRLRNVDLPNCPLVLSKPNLAILFHNIRRELRDGDDLSDMAIEGLSWELTCELVRGSRRRKPSSVPSIARQASEIIRAQISNPPSISVLSLELGIHRSQLSRSFKATFGITLSNFVRKCRIEKAIDLLEKDNLSIAEIALECGFNDQSHFTRCFRVMMSTTPAKWRKGELT